MKLPEDDGNGVPAEDVEEAFRHKVVTQEALEG